MTPLTLDYVWNGIETSMSKGGKFDVSQKIQFLKQAQRNQSVLQVSYLQYSIRKALS